MSAETIYDPSDDVVILIAGEAEDHQYIVCDADDTVEVQQ